MGGSTDVDINAMVANNQGNKDELKPPFIGVIPMRPYETTVEQSRLKTSSNTTCRWLIWPCHVTRSRRLGHKEAGKMKTPTYSSRRPPSCVDPMAV